MQRLTRVCRSWGWLTTGDCQHVLCRTVSKALLQSIHCMIAMTITYELLTNNNKCVTLWRIVNIAAAVDPVGLKTHCSSKVRHASGCCIAGYIYIYLWTKVLSVILVKTGDIEIGMKSACCVGTVTLGTGRIQACFHWRGTVEAERERLKKTIEAGSQSFVIRLVLFTIDWGWQWHGWLMLEFYPAFASNSFSFGL